MTQNEQIRQHLEKYGQITSMEAFREYGCTRLSARIYELRHKSGLEITGETKTTKNRQGETVNYAVYRLKKQTAD